MKKDYLCFNERFLWGIKHSSACLSVKNASQNIVRGGSVFQPLSVYAYT